MTDQEVAKFLKASSEGPPFQRGNPALAELVIRLNQWHHYYEFLRIIRTRHQRVSEKFREHMKEALAYWRSLPQGSRETTDKDLEYHGKSREFQFRLSLDIESFYLFAAILLDHAAETVPFYFNIKDHKKPRRIAKWDNDALTKSFLDTAASLNIQGDITGLVQQASKLQGSVTNYRNRKITHLDNHRRFFGIGFNDEGTWISGGIMNPTPEESDPFPKTTELNTLFEKIDAYLACVFKMLAQNQAQSILQPTTSSSSSQP